jgi:PAS domain S-box-containing protein
MQQRILPPWTYMIFEPYESISPRGANMLQKSLRQQGFAALCVAIAVALRFVIALFWPDIQTFVTYYPAILIATLVYGLPAGISATLLGAAAGWWLFARPVHSFYVLFYLLSSAVIVWAAGRHRMLVQQLRTEVSLREIAQESNARLATLVAQSPDAIISCAPDATINTWNSGAEKLFGYTAAEAAGRPMVTLVPDDKRQEVEKIIFPPLRSGATATFETILITKAGERVPVSIAAGPIRDMNGHIIGACATIRDIRERAQHQQQMQIVMQEMSHRARNLLTNVLAMVHKISHQADDFKQFKTQFAERLQALARSHDVLVERNWSSVPMEELARVQLSPFQEVDGVRLTTSGPDVVVKAKAAEQIGLCLHELATNAAKYGALSAPTGAVTIEWRVDTNGDREQCFRLTWREQGGPAVTKPTRSGFGNLVTHRLVPEMLHGKASLEFAPEGITWKLVCPAAEVVSVD